ncbi:MAG: hypothetical protein P8X63_07895 [Desulfuromonadaceae bacterium]|jgi:ribosomal protein L34
MVRQKFFSVKKQKPPNPLAGRMAHLCWRQSIIVRYPSQHSLHGKTKDAYQSIPKNGKVNRFLKYSNNPVPGAVAVNGAGTFAFHPRFQASGKTRHSGFRIRIRDKSGAKAIEKPAENRPAPT